MTIPIYQVDAFAAQVFEGNPAAVCVLEQWPEAQLMQKIAAENNLSETAFLVAQGEGFQLRWFTPTTEVALCGHATLASAHTLFEHCGYTGKEIAFYTKSGLLSVKKEEDRLWMNFPESSLQKDFPSFQLIDAIGTEPLEVYRGGEDLLLVFESEKMLRDLKPNFSKIMQLPVRGLIATALGEEYDFVSRFFGPAVGVNEDPVTGSAHTSLIPYWAKRLHKKSLQAKQISKRGGVLYCEQLAEGRVAIGGHCFTYLVGQISLPNL
jgi:PhzF family phenazine biosynthesis protein